MQKKIKELKFSTKYFFFELFAQVRSFVVFLKNIIRTKIQMYHTVIIDDDQLARRGLRRILEQNFPEIKILGEADSVASGIKLIDEVDPDLVFLDIEMPDGTGFRLLEQISEVDFKVVFTTSYSDYAITAFKYSAF
ncbi:MAG: response regulator, partial [Bacteroidota bacterium]|nr:response regulator [Bacteroidota bacterium]